MDSLLEKIYGMTGPDREECARHLMIGGGTRGGPMIVRGQGVRVYDQAGKDYIDCTSQSWAMYLGYANPEINRVVAEQMERMSHIHQGFDTPPRYWLARKLAELAPGDLNRVSFTAGGGLAIEAAMKIAYKNTQPSRDFLCLTDSYHGTTLATMGASWISTRAAGKLIGGSRFLGLTKSFTRIPNPYCYRCPLGRSEKECAAACLEAARQTIERGTAGNVAGILVEPIQASGGQIILPAEYLRGLRALCDEYRIPLIFDEIQTYARIGRFFAADYFGVTPDMIVLGKGLGAGLPIAAVIVSDKMQGFEPDAEELHTFANNSVAQVAAAKQIEILENGLLDHTREMGEYLRAGLAKMQTEFPEIGDIRQAGLHIGVELVRDPKSKTPATEEGAKVWEEAIRLGLILGKAGFRKNILKVKPPLIVSRPECDEILAKFHEALRKVLRK